MEWMGFGWLSLGGRRYTMLINTGTAVQTHSKKYEDFQQKFRN